MSWVRTAAENAKLQGYERLHQTVYGGYGTKPDIFWALDPYDMPEKLKDNVEETVKDDGSSEATCAIIRMETLPALDDDELRESGNPLACFMVYMGTDPSNVEYIRRINICEDKRPETPPHLRELTDANGLPISRLKRLSVNMGWTDPYTLYNNKPNNARHSTMGPSPPREDGSIRRRMTLQPSWVDRSRRRSSAHESKRQSQPLFDRRMSSRRLKRATMFPALSNVSEAPAPDSPPAVREVEDASATSPKPSLEARPSGDGKVRSRRPKRAKASSVIRESPSEAEAAVPSSPPADASKRESATEAALLALEGRAGAAGAEEDLPQYLLDARLGMPPTPAAAAAAAATESRSSSPGRVRVDAAVRKLKTLSLSAVGRASPDVRAELGDEFPPRPSPARSLHQRLDAASRKLKTLSMASLGVETPPARAATPVVAAAEKPDAAPAGPDAAPEAPAAPAPPRAERPSRRRTLFFGAARKQTDPSSSPSRLSKARGAPPKAPSPSASPKPQGQAVSRVKETAEGKPASRLKRFSTHVSRLFN